MPDNSLEQAAKELYETASAMLDQLSQLNIPLSHEALLDVINLTSTTIQTLIEASVIEEAGNESDTTSKG